MVLSLRPEIQRLIDDQVRAGRFPTPEALVETAISEMLHGTEEILDDETVAAIKRGRDQLERGEEIDFADVRAHWKKRLER